MQYAKMPCNPDPARALRMVVKSSIEQSEPKKSTELLPLTHDEFFTGTFQTKRLAKGFLRVVLPKELLECLDLDGLTFEPRHVTDDIVVRDRVVDVVYRVPIKETEQHIDFFTVLEHKSFNDLWTVFQLWRYVYRICQQEYDKVEDANRGHVPAGYRLPPVIAIVIHHGESRFTGKTELSELFLQLPGIEKYLPKLQAVLFDLNVIADDAIPEDPEVPEMKLVLAALKLVFRKDVTTKIAEILEELKPISDDPVFQDFVRAVWCYLVSSAKYMEGYEELQGIVNSVVEVEAMPTMLEKWTADAVAKREAEKKDEWTATAEANKGRNMVLTALRKKFNTIPKEIEQAVLAMSDPIAMESVLEHVFDSNTLDEFATVL